MNKLNFDTLENIAIIYGEDYYLVSEFIDNIISLLPQGSQDIDLVIANENDNLRDILFECGNLPFMSPRRVVLLRRDKALLTNEKKALDEYIKNPSDCTVFLILDNGGVFKNYYKKVKSYEFNRLDSYKLSLRLKGILGEKDIHMDNEAIDLLIEYTNRYMSRIAIEIKKLIAYIGDRDRITVEDIKESVTPEADYQIYQFINAATQKNKSIAIKLYHELLDSGIPTIVLLSAMTNQYRKLLHLLLIGNRVEDLQLAKLFKAPLFTISKDRNLAKRYTQKELKEIVDKLYDLEYSFKSGRMTVDNALDTAVAMVIT